ncbi:MAG: M3 family peptidase [Planctomycetota bacterium]|nr:MAG: M3 family peptidase [Planctomycetota bacterium]
MSENPLLETQGLPRFQSIRAEHVEPAVRQRIAEYDALVDELLARGGPYTWEDFVEPLDEAAERIERAWGPVQHLNAVRNNEELRAAIEATQPVLAEWSARVSQDERLYRATQELYDRADAAGLDPVQRRVLELDLRDFRLAGVDLPAEKKERYREIQVELAELSTRFANNVLDVTKEWRLVVDDPADLEGLPESLVAMARAKALEDDPEAPEHRWTFTLHAPCVQPFLQYQRNRELRKSLYLGYVTRASEGERDNAPLIDRILTLRAELAELLGFENYAQVSLAKKMADTPEQVMSFLNDLAERSKPFGERDRDALEALARADGLERLEAWDVAFYREKLRQERYSFSDEEVRQYFPHDRVLAGLFETLRRLYGLELRDVTEERDLELWHPSVRVVEVRDAEGERGLMLLDLFARDDKRGGAWMGECLSRRRRRGELQLPVAYLCCNFAPPADGKPSLLRHREVQTLFHECGHALHHVLTRVDRRQVAGINRVPWDGVELPSQFHENWTWQKESLAYLAGHHETGEPLPDALLEKMLAAKTFMAGADMLRQLEFAIFDMELHTGYRPGGARSVHEVLEEVRARVGLFPKPPEDRFECAFSHIFAGGYAAGYYSYKWAEVLAADAFSRFEEEGLFSPEAGKSFREFILERGGSRDLMELYKEFRGREPTPDALLRHSGLVAA